MEKLKDHINMHFIGQVKKRKADNEPEKGQENEESQSSSQSNSGDSPSEHQSKRAKKDDEESGLSIAVESEPPVDIKQEKEKEGGLKCANCDTSFFNVTTFRAHVSYYCKNRDNDQN